MIKHLIERQKWWAVHAIRMIVAGVTTLAAVYALELTVELSAVISAIAVTQSNIGGSLGKAFEQGVGSFLGAVVAAIVALALRPDDPASTVLALALALAPLSVLAAFSVGFQIAPITAAVVLLGGPGLEVGPDVLAAERLLGVALGSGVGLLTGLLVLPARASRSAVEAAARVAGLLAAQLHAIAPGDGTGEDALAARAGEIRRGLSELATDVRDAARERRLSFGRGPDPERALHALRRVRHDVDMLRRAARGAGVDALPGALAEPWRRAATGAAGTLAHVEGLLGGRPISGPAVPLEPIVRDYRAALDGMRQAGLTRTMPTPDLARLFGIKFALRQLERDLADLTSVAQDFSVSRRRWWR
ncbi:FUSC family protein [uncultured Paracoccus sp.]|uniref:FUSC family protein n=1 Tax=uncultured Paracoccus sp. TaxID=189685 RepID=UPI0026140A8B|nr:FUSC family protein [uncultured Paracoccus sp.]